MSWIAQRTTGRDLVIGENAVEIPFHFGHRAALSYSPYSTTDYLTYRGLLDYLAIPGAEHERIYLVITRHGEPNEGLASTYGPFVTDLVFGRTHSYPCIVPLARLQDGDVFEIRRPEGRGFASRNPLPPEGTMSAISTHGPIKLAIP